MIRMPLPEKPLFGMILFPSCGNGLAPVLEILMNNNVVSPIFWPYNISEHERVKFHNVIPKAYIVIFQMTK